MTYEPTPPLYDLRAFFHAVGGGPQAGGALSSEPIERTDLSAHVDLVDPDPAPLTGEPLGVAAFVDGVQSALTVTYRSHRPVFLTYQAAGAVGARAHLLALRERLTLVASHLDLAWVEEVNTAERPLPVEYLAATSPLDVERDAYALVRDWRDRLERQLVEQALTDRLYPLIVDGSLRDRPAHLGLYGVVKDVSSTRYLPDERALYGLRHGWRSPIFKIVGSGAITDRYSCYVRLHDATDRGWNFGLIRLESRDPDTLTPLGITTMSERQSPRSGDGRWDRHLASVAVTEKVLRARRPAVFDRR